MKEKFETAIIGNKETILGFKALGLQTFDAKNSEEALEILTDLKSKTIALGNDEKRPEFAIIFITEELASGIDSDDYKKLSKDVLPAIIPVPGSKGTTGYGLKRIGKMVEQAVGSDIMG